MLALAIASKECADTATYGNEYDPFRVSALASRGWIYGEAVTEMQRRREVSYWPWDLWSGWTHDPATHLRGQTSQFNLAIGLPPRWVHLQNEVRGVLDNRALQADDLFVSELDWNVFERNRWAEWHQLPLPMLTSEATEHAIASENLTEIVHGVYSIAQHLRMEGAPIARVVVALECDPEVEDWEYMIVRVQASTTEIDEAVALSNLLRRKVDEFREQLQPAMARKLYDRVVVTLDVV